MRAILALIPALTLFSAANAAVISNTSPGTVASVAVSSANGFAGTVATATTTPTLTISTTVTGVLLGNGTSVSAAPTSGTGSLVLTSGASLVDVLGLGLRDTSAAFDLTFAATSSTALTAGRTLTFDVVNGARTVKLGSNLTIVTDPGAVTGALKSNGSGTFTAAACADLSNGATGCSTATGTSGATIPLLNGTNTFGANQTMAAGFAFTNAIGEFAPSSPGIVSSIYYAGVLRTGTVAGNALLANTIYFSAFANPAKTTYTEIGARITTLSTGNCQLAIYKLVAGVPNGAALYSSGNLAATGTGPITATAIAKTLDAGIYALAINCSATPLINFMVDSGLPFVWGTVTDNGTETLMVTAQTFGTWPTSPALSRNTNASSASPEIWLRK